MGHTLFKRSFRKGARNAARVHSNNTIVAKRFVRELEKKGGEIGAKKSKKK